MKQVGVWVVLLLLGGVGTAGAALLPAVNGQVYDDVLEISWLEDANFVKTSCDLNNALWQAFDPSSITGNSGRSKTHICDQDDGGLNWNEAEGWIAVLNANNHLGHSDWRQWQVPNPTNDPSCSDQDSDAQGSDKGYRCTGSELGNLFNATLGNPNQLDDGCFPNCLVNTGPFSNFQSLYYWSGTVYAPSPFNAWGFVTAAGSQDRGDVIFNYMYVWPVRPGQDVGAPAPPPIPMTSCAVNGSQNTLIDIPYEGSASIAFDYAPADSEGCYFVGINQGDLTWVPDACGEPLDFLGGNGVVAEPSNGGLLVTFPWGLLGTGPGDQTNHVVTAYDGGPLPPSVSESTEVLCSLTLTNLPESTDPTPPPPPVDPGVPPTAIPTLSHLGLIVLAGLFVMLAWAGGMRRKVF